jgi:quercetin dioxygenase-like cupin family protein
VAGFDPSLGGLFWMSRDSQIKRNQKYVVLELKIILSEGGNTMKVIKVAKIAREPNSGKLFTGIVTVQPVIGKHLSKNLVIAKVSFGPGVRNKFHSHSSEQILIVTKGKGIVATEKELKTVVVGDVIFIPPFEKHWHGAAEGSKFSHLYIMSPDSKTTQLEE